MTADEKSNKMLRWAKIIQGLCIVAMPIYVRILAQGQAFGYIPIEQLDTLVLNILTVVLTLLALFSLALVYVLPRQPARSRLRSGMWKSMGPEMRAFTNYFLQSASVEAVAVYGLLLGFLGAGWNVVLPFLFVSVAALIITFPTRNRWDKMLQTLRDEPA